MYQLQARACQTKSGVYVTLAGFLANSCMQAEISETYRARSSISSIRVTVKSSSVKSSAPGAK